MLGAEAPRTPHAEASPKGERGIVTYYGHRNRWLSRASRGDWLGHYSWAADGNTIVLGAAWDDDKGTDSGSVYLFEYDDGNWPQTHLLAYAEAARECTYWASPGTRHPFNGGA